MIDERVFKKNIAKFYNEVRPAGYYQIMADVEKFSEWYTILYNCRKNGETGDDILLATHEMWKEEHNNKVFEYEDMWSIKKRKNLAPQPFDVHADKKVRTSESGAYRSLNNLEMWEECGAGSCSMDQQNATKMKDKAEWEQMQRHQMKKLALYEEELIRREEFLKLRKDELDLRDYHIIMTDATFHQIQQHTMKKLASLEEELKLREDEVELRESNLRMKDYDIVMKDTSGMTQTQLKVHTRMVEIIMERQGLAT